jgi:hypothetical protein
MENKMFNSFKKTLFVAAIAAGSLASVTANAADKTPGSGPNPFTDCGIGAALFPDTGWAAVTSNVIWDVGTTALTSATASPETCSGKKVATAKFILDTYENVVEDTASGEGEYITAMLNIYGCAADQQSGIVSSIREEFSVDVTSTKYEKMNKVEKANAYYNTLTEVVESKFAASCTA